MNDWTIASLIISGTLFAWQALRLLNNLYQCLYAIHIQIHAINALRLREGK